MGKKSKKIKTPDLARLRNLDMEKCKTKCCKKYKKCESKRCKKCPCFDLLKKVA